MHDVEKDTGVDKKRVVLMRVVGAIALSIVLLALQYAVWHGQHIEAKRKGSMNTLSVWTNLVESLKFQEVEGNFPPWDQKHPGAFMYDQKDVTGLYKLGGHYSRGPEDKDASILMVADFLDNKTAYNLDAFPGVGDFYYFSYAITNETEGMTMLDIYRKALESGEALNADMKVEPGKGTSGGDVLYFMHSNLGWHLESVVKVAPVGSNVHLKIPVLMERPNKYDKPGGWVVFLHSQPRWIDHPGEFPMTESFVGALEAFEKEFSKTPSEEVVQ